MWYRGTACGMEALTHKCCIPSCSTVLGERQFGPGMVCMPSSLRSESDCARSLCVGHIRNFQERSTLR